MGSQPPNLCIIGLLNVLCFVMVNKLSLSLSATLAELLLNDELYLETVDVTVLREHFLLMFPDRDTYELQSMKQQLEALLLLYVIDDDDDDDDVQ